MKKHPTYSFDDFLKCFPDINLPVNLTDMSIFTFEQENKPFLQGIIEQFIIPIEEGIIDEFTEFLPCFRLKDTHQFNAVVFWKAQLLQYQYILATFDQEHNLIKSAIIAGTQTSEDKILQSVAHIDEDWMIHIIEGTQNAESQEYNPKDSQQYNMEILATGEIIFSLNDEFV